MKRKLNILTSATAASFLAFTTLAQEQDTPDSKSAGTAYTHQSVTHLRADRLNAAAKTSDIIGMTVKNHQGEKLGKVDDLSLDVESGRIVQVILSTGGFLGMGNTLTAVPPGALREDAANKVILLDTSRESLKSAPKFDTAKWDEASQSNQVFETYSYYGEQPYFVANRSETWTTNKDGTLSSTLPLHMDGTLNTDAPRTVERTRNAAIAANGDDKSNTFSTRNPDGSWTRQRYSNDNGARSSWSNLGFVQKASKLTGTSVKNLQDQKLGKVENFIVDLSAGRIIVVIISSGGFIGMGDELSAVPPTALRFNAEHDILQLDASKEMLASSPHFKANEWPDLSQPGYAGGVYRAYRVEPYFATDATSDADNTRQNVRDRDSRTLTPLDQGNSPADMTITSEIRKGILADKNMSINARNVKVITVNGQVTLRGPVNTSEEKRGIEAIANDIARPGNVNNQLEVTRSTSPSSNN